MKRKQLLIIAACYAVVILAVFNRVWRGEMYFGWDCLRQYWMDLFLPVDALRDGELPLWNPYSLGGYPFWADPITGFLHPVNWLCYLLSAITGSNGAWLMQLKVLVNMWIGLCGMHILCARRTGSHAAGVLAAIVFVFGSPMLVHKGGALLWPMLYLPWSMLALERFLEKPGPRRGAQMALGVWLCGTAGHPQSFFYGLVIMFCYWAFRTARAPATLRDQWKGLVWFVVLALLLLVPLYLPASRAIALSSRSVRDLDYVLQQSLGADKLRELFIPNLDTDWMSDVYVGPAVLVLAILAVIAAEKRAEAIFWLGMAVFGLLLALGRNTPVLPFLAKYVPGFGLHRIAYRHKLIFGFAIAVAGAGGLEAALRRPRLLWGLAAAWIVPVAIFAFKIKAALWAVLLAGPALILIGVGKRAQALALVLVFADLLVAGQIKLDILQPPPDMARDRDTLARMPGADTQYRYFSDEIVPYHVPYIYKVRELTGRVNPMALQRREHILAHASIPLLEKMNVRWWWARAKLPLAPTGPLYVLPDAVALARVYPAAETVPTAKMLDRLGAPGRLDVALVEPDDVAGPLPASTFAPVDAKVTTYRRNRIDVDVDAPAPGILVLNEPIFPDWRVEVNGEPATLFRANYFLRAVVVPAGVSKVTFRYVPPLAVPLWVMFALGLAATLVVARRL
jgi:hypothetical protein